MTSICRPTRKANLPRIPSGTSNGLLERQFSIYSMNGKSSVVTLLIELKSESLLMSLTSSFSLTSMG